MTNLPLYHVSFTTPHNICEEQLAEQLLRIWFQFPKLKPEFADSTEPLNTKILTLEDALPIWMSDWFFWKRKTAPKAEGAVLGKTRFGYCDLKFEFAHDANSNMDAFFKAMAIAAGAEFGYLHIMSKNEFNRPLATHEAAYGFRMGAFGRFLSEKWANLGWATIFGPQQSIILPLEALTDAGFTIERWEGGVIQLKLTPNITDIINDYDFFEARRKLAKVIIGEDRFSKQ